MTGDVLIVLLADREIGQVHRDERARLRFQYHEAWRSYQRAYPLSLSMPLAAAEHEHATIEAFLWGLLPDNEIILNRWARRFQISPRNAFGLIKEVGEDCAGAVQFVRPERLDAFRSDQPRETEWLTHTDIARRLRDLRTDVSAWRSPGDAGQFSLAGAQPKTAFCRDAGRWGVPSGRMPTTHILKPSIDGLDGHAENEHICLSLARALRIPAASSEVMQFEGEVAIVVERYDRVSTADLAKSWKTEASARGTVAHAGSGTLSGTVATVDALVASARAHGFQELARTQPILRVHQEDVCQALGLPPTAKYQNEGGPGPERIVDLLRTHSARPVEDVSTFVDALAFNWIIAGTDAHAKNYSLLQAGGGHVRLAPLYDVASALPYDRLDLPKLKLAMKIGGEYRLLAIGFRQWEKLAFDLRLDPEGIFRRVAALAAAMPEQVEILRRRARQEGLTHPIVDRLADSLTGRATKCLQTMRL